MLDYITTFTCACCDPEARFIPHVQNAKKKKVKSNFLRRDPSRTMGLQKKMYADAKRRLRKLKDRIWELIVEEDAFGLKLRKAPTAGTLFNADRQRWRFLTDDKKVGAFNLWLQQEIDSGILQVQDGENAWTAQYIQAAYKKGITRAFRDVNKLDAVLKSDVYNIRESQFLRDSLAAPETTSKLKMLGTRTFTQLRGITSGMDANMSRVLVSGLAEGRGVLSIADDLIEQVGFTEARALRLAKTEIMFAHGEGQLDAFEALGVDELGVLAEWSTAGDNWVCPICEPLEGTVLTVKEARGMLPRHPNCRCTWIPANVTESEKKQKRSKGDITGAITESLKRETKQKTLKKAKEKSRWAGANKKLKGKATQKTPIARRYKG